ncbi:MAG: hypothetical protein ACRDKW_07885, partial [Actinomycetota bacterium]
STPARRLRPGLSPARRPSRRAPMVTRRRATTNRAVQAAGATVSWGIDGCADLEAIDPRLRCMTCLSACDLEGFRDLPMQYRPILTVGRLLPALKASCWFSRGNLL